MRSLNYKQATEVRDVFRKYRVRYLFIGKAGAVLLGFPDTTQDIDLFIDKSQNNCDMLIQAIIELGFQLSDPQKADIMGCVAMIKLKNGPFDLDLVFAPDSIEGFSEAWGRHVEIEGFPVASIEDIINSKRAANRTKDRESLRRLSLFRDWLHKRGTFIIPK